MNVDDDDADGPLDPRIEMELENLNNATDDINQLEIELDEARRAFDQLHSDLKNQFIEEQNKAGSTNITKAKAYYEAVAARNEAQFKCRREAESFRKASENLAAAMETESVAMNSFKLHQHKFNESWQEWLNQVTAQVMEDSNKKMACQREHQKITAHYNEAEKRVKELGEKYRKALIKTKPYFEIKERIEQELPLQKEKIRCLEKSIQRAKCIYANSLRALEEISNQIHQRRRDYDIIANGPREPGVGAELVTPEESLKFNDDTNKIIISRKNSMGSNSDADKEEAEQDLKDIRELRRSIDNLGGRSVDGSESTSSQWELELQAGLEKLNNPPLSSMQQIQHLNLLSDKSVQQSSALKTDPIQNNISSDNVSECSAMSLTPKKSFLSSISNVQYQGWHSLTQSPINSIFVKSKMALKTSFSKSLVNSPVNKSAFTFNKPKSKEQIEEKVNNESQIKSKEQMMQSEPRPHSLDSSPVHKQHFASSNNVKSFHTDSKDLKVPSKAIELPLLTIFSDTKTLNMSKDKSCSMINLNDKKSLKGLLGKTVMNNIQAVSVERLANARSKLIADGS